ncbi:cation:proton antiporter [Streptomyces prunicolor]|uniref:cation:proton antiporter n=1 Tax=Streptomyces prunicolor TaxID=67348 RepID=UPI000374A099|nr:cation:proton antiporter [Streptomyces prunicolor]
MHPWHHGLLLLHLATVMAGAVVVVAAGRWAARRTRQPEVIGEIAAGMLTGPLLLWALGADRFHTVLPTEILSWLKHLAELGLVLFLVEFAHRLKDRHARPSLKSAAWVTLGSFVPALAAGALLAAWVTRFGAPSVRGSAPAPAFFLLVAVTLAVTAVPVLARVITDRHMTDTAPGRLALSSAIAIDSAAWLLLALAVGLRTGQPGSFLKSVGVLALGALTALLLNRLLRTHHAQRLCDFAPRAAQLCTAALAMALAFTTAHFGMTLIFGAVLAGFALPGTVCWKRVTQSVGRIGALLLPIYFVATGLTALTRDLTGFSASLTLLTVALATLAKIGGGWLGARLSGHRGADGLRVGVLMNTRGLTELIILQVGLSAGVLTPPLYLSLVIMALVTTACTAPALTLIDRFDNRGRTPGAAPAPHVPDQHTAGTARSEEI